MNEVIAWAVFAGTWLLVAGPLYQGAIELHELEIDREALQAAGGRVPQPKMPSAWWWLVPPVMYVLATRRNKAYQRAVLAEMTETQRDQLVSFQNKAAGWLTVAAGGALLAAGETWEVAEHYRWPQWVFWLVLVVMLAGALLNTVIRRRNANPFFRGPDRQPVEGQALS